jgi:hypothetical protein
MLQSIAIDADLAFGPPTGGSFPATRSYSMRPFIKWSLATAVVLFVILAAWTLYPIALAYLPDRCMVPGVSAAEQAAIKEEVGSSNLLAGFSRLDEQGVRQKPRMERVAQALAEIVDRQASFPAQLVALDTAMRATGAVFHDVRKISRQNAGDDYYLITYALPAAFYGPILPLPGQRWGSFQAAAERSDGRLQIMRASVGWFDWINLSPFRGKYEGPCITPDSFSD